MNWNYYAKDMYECYCTHRKTGEKYKLYVPVDDIETEHHAYDYDESKMSFMQYLADIQRSRYPDIVLYKDGEWTCNTYCRPILETIIAQNVDAEIRLICKLTILSPSA